MRAFGLVFITIMSSVWLAGCDTLAKEQEKCEQGDQAACERLESLGIALEELVEAVPEDLIVASSFELESAGSFLEKQTRLAGVLNQQTIEADGIAACIRAIPQLPDWINDPECYGPAINYVDHPNGAGAPDMNQDGDNDPTTGTLPTGDVGIWTDTVNGMLAGNTNQTACAAAKMNELIGKAAFNVDLATSTTAMMACAAAIDKRGLPDNDNQEFDFSSLLSEANSQIVSVTTAKVKKVLLDSEVSYVTTVAGSFANQQYGSFSIRVQHVPGQNKGLMQIERPDRGDQRATSVLYEIANSTLKYQLKSALFRGHSDYYDEHGEVDMRPVDDEMNPTYGNSADAHFMIAEQNQNSGVTDLAYGWNAGGRDDHYRTFNAEISGAEAWAYYGYVPNTWLDNTPVTVDLDLSENDTGVICNWAGPNNSHIPISYLQYQKMDLVSEVWQVSTSNIKYAPTVAHGAVNYCEIEDLGGSGIVFKSVQQDMSQQPPVNTDILTDGTIDTNSVVGAGDEYLHDLWNKTGTMTFTMPVPPTELY